MIIDSHAHLHPSQADLADWDCESDEATLREHQRVLYLHHRPPAVTASGETVREAWKLLWKDQRPSSWEGRTAVNFRIVAGRFVWEKDSVIYSAPARPAADAALLVRLMDAVGVEKAVLHASLPYNRFYGRAARAYPGRFLPLAYLELLPWAHRIYLHERTDELIKVVYDTFGPTKFTWGTEFIKAAFPHTVEHYAELRSYFELRCPYMSAEDIALIQGGNLQRLFGLAGQETGRG